MFGKIIHGSRSIHGPIYVWIVVPLCAAFVLIVTHLNVLLISINICHIVVRKTRKNIA